ncbi:MAG: NAD-dependent epimerase/dehydratase family protein [Elusimicrobia bacterium]|nr:NAD-dependent epimerase/dehydratase family protein [Elusimicrobiota bacterium]
MADLAFVTGATGFVGANLARLLLAKGLRVRALARPNSDRRGLKGLDVEVVEGDLLDKASLEKACQGARWVFNVAADYRIWVPDPKAMLRANVDGTVNVLRAAGKAKAERIVHCSSVAAVRLDKTGGSADEDSHYSGPDEIIGVYKRSKWLSERAALELASEGLPVVVVNPAAPIGPWDGKPTPTGKILVDFLNRKLPSYVDTGLNLIHVGDVAEGHWLAAQRGKVGERYILGGENLTLKAMLDLLAEESGLPAPRFQTPYAVAYAFGALDTLRLNLIGGTPVAPLDAVRMARYKMFFSAAKAVRELGLPQRSARQAVADAVAWFREHGYAPRPAARA